MAGTFYQLRRVIAPFTRRDDSLYITRALSQDRVEKINCRLIKAIVLASISSCVPWILSNAFLLLWIENEPVWQKGQRGITRILSLPPPIYVPIWCTCTPISPQATHGSSATLAMCLRSAEVDLLIHHDRCICLIIRYVRNLPLVIKFYVYSDSSGYFCI